MKNLLFVFVAVIVTSCSFDNKTGIWKDATNTLIDNQTTKSITDNKSNTRYEDVFIKNKSFNEEKESTNVSNVEFSPAIKITNWFEQYAVSTNNISNFSYNNNKMLLSKSAKLSKSSSRGNNSSKKIVFYKNNLISHDHNGTIFIYSLSLKKKHLNTIFIKRALKILTKKFIL